MTGARYRLMLGEAELRMLHKAVAPALADEGWRRGTAIGLVDDLKLELGATYTYDQAGLRVLTKIEHIIESSEDIRRSTEATKEPKP